MPPNYPSISVPKKYIDGLERYIKDVERVRSITPLAMDMKVQQLVGYLKYLQEMNKK